MLRPHLADGTGPSRVTEAGIRPASLSAADLDAWEVVRPAQWPAARYPALVRQGSTARASPRPLLEPCLPARPWPTPWRVARRWCPRPARLRDRRHARDRVCDGSSPAGPPTLRSGFSGLP